MYVELSLSHKYHNLSKIDVIDIHVDNIYINKRCTLPTKNIEYYQVLIQKILNFPHRSVN